MPASIEALGARDAIPTTPSDLLEQPFDALKVVDPGDVSVITKAGVSRTLTFSIAGEIWPVGGSKVLSTGTDSTIIYRLIY